MTRYGYTLMCEQSAPTSLVRDALRAEEVGFEFAVISDHYFPWLDSQAHAPNAWPVLGAVAQAATVGLLSDGRFTLGLGAGENLNEHVVGKGWPPVNIRHEMLHEAVQIIRALFAGEYVNFTGEYYRIDSAKLWDVGAPPPPIGIAVSGAQSLRLAGEHADVLIAVEPDPELTAGFDAVGGRGKRRVGQVPICWDPDRDSAIARAHDQFRWFAGGWKVNAELPGTAGFAAATRFVTPDDVASSIPCGPDLDAHIAAIREFEDAGFTDIAVVQIGGEHQDGFLDWARGELLPALRRD